MARIPEKVIFCGFQYTLSHIFSAPVLESYQVAHVPFTIEWHEEVKIWLLDVLTDFGMSLLLEPLKRPKLLNICMYTHGLEFRHTPAPISVLIYVLKTMHL